MAALIETAAPGHHLRRAHRAGGPTRRTGGRDLPGARHGPLRELRHRGGHERGAAGASRHRPRADTEVRRLLPRPRRRAARGGGLRRGHAGAARLPGRNARARWRTPWCSPTTIWPQSRPSSRRGGTRSPRFWWSRWRATWGWSRRRPGFLQGLSEHHPPVTARCWSSTR